MSSNNARSRGRPKVDSERVDVRIDRSVLEAMDAFAASEKDAPSRPEAVRRILRDWLIGHGYIASPED